MAATANRFSVLAETDGPLPTPLSRPPNEEEEGKVPKPRTRSGPTRVFIGNISDEQEWNDVVERASTIGVVKSKSPLINSKKSKHSFGFITMKYHGDAADLIEAIGEEKDGHDVGYGYDYMFLIKFKLLYAQWATSTPTTEKPKRKKKTTVDLHQSTNSVAVTGGRVLKK